MGTNYYLHRGFCQHCKKADEIKHIGKSSVGWCFTLRIHPAQDIIDLPDWEKLFADSNNVIKDEYGKVLTAEEMLIAIKDRKRISHREEVPFGHKSWKEFYDSNYAEPGPNNLIRYKVGIGCHHHGVGTWDCVIGEFY